jgi:hypothetical protein
VGKQENDKMIIRHLENQENDVMMMIKSEQSDVFNLN